MESLLQISTTMANLIFLLKGELTIILKWCDSFCISEITLTSVRSNLFFFFLYYFCFRLFVLSFLLHSNWICFFSYHFVNSHFWSWNREIKTLCCCYFQLIRICFFLDEQYISLNCCQQKMKCLCLIGMVIFVQTYLGPATIKITHKVVNVLFGRILVVHFNCMILFSYCLFHLLCLNFFSFTLFFVFFLSFFFWFFSRFFVQSSHWILLLIYSLFDCLDTISVIMLQLLLLRIPMHLWISMVTAYLTFF